MAQNYSTRGVHFMNEMQVDSDKIEGKLQNETIFSLDNNGLVNANIVNNELVLEYDRKENPSDHNLTEIRFFVQNDTENVLEQIEGEIKKHVKMLDQTDDLICVLPELPFLVPRGKYTADIFKKHIKLHGQSFNFTFGYENIKKAFLLPLPDGENIYFVLNFDKPLRQGQTIYNYGIINFKVDMSIEIDLKPKESILKEISSKLEKKMEGQYYDVFSKLFKFISNINITVPGDFKNSKGHNSVKCSIKAKQGDLFLLNQSLLFAPKPICHISYNEILTVEFHRMDNQMSNRNFDFEVITKQGEKTIFSGIDKGEGEFIINHFKNRSVKIVVIKEENINEDDYEDEEDASNEKESQNKYEGEFIDGEDSEDEDEDFDPTKIKKNKDEDQ